MKALIPVAGIGSRLRPHTHTQPKPLIPVAGKPILAHIIDSLLAVGIEEQIFIVGYLRDKVQQFIETNYQGKIKAHFAVQEPRRGLAHALWVGRKHFKDESEILVFLGDTIIFPKDIRPVLAEQGSVIGVFEVDNPGEFGVAVSDKDGWVQHLVEKPTIPTSNLALVGIYKIDQIPLFIEVLDQMMRQALPANREYALTTALDTMVERGVPMRTLRIENWFDCGRKQSLLRANRVLLERIRTLEHYDFPNTVIVHPVHIAPGCDIRDSIVGPYVAVADGAVIHHAIVDNSILGAYSRLEHIILSQSVIGSDTTLRGRTTSLNIGDNTEMDLSG